MSGPGSKVRVMVVDDSALVRRMLSDVLNADAELEVVATASDPFIAVQKLRAVPVDVITLDIEMPRMDGLTFLQKLMRQNPMPVVMCSSLARQNAESTLRALELGAAEIITKPAVGMRSFFEDEAVRIRDTVKAAAFARVRGGRPAHRETPTGDSASSERLDADAIISRGTRAMTETTERVVVIGASTGGTEAIRTLLSSFPDTCPGTVIVQHMPEHFTRAFAERLDAQCRPNVREAKNGDTILPGQVLIAPGNQHAIVKRSGARYYVAVQDGPLVSRHRPSVDVLFRSAARYAGPNAVGAILTGMGDDGARGLRELRDAGAYTVAQDEATSVVFGMPKEAIRRGGAQHVMRLTEIAGALLKNASNRPLGA